ncbi:GntR family transcriptional regulator [Paracoccus ravus]|uniref:GntR family transcriptional regulator n=1 Tax=Paracoccus ravus TaxID=2447760 RepID=UPI00106EF02E|nr:GntR family transcriptional regulator [Paracoccus ravus]
MKAKPALLAKETDPGVSTAMQVERELREAIISLDLKPGARLSEQEVADRLQVSRQPVREALIALGRAHLVETWPKRGTTVVKISVRKMTEARFVREAIETAVVQRACAAFDPFARRRIDAILDRQRAACEANDHTLFRKQDEQFHASIAEGAGCALAWSVIADIKAQVDRVCNLQIRQASSMAELIAQHERIVEAIDRRDADAATTAMRDHLSAILTDLPEIALNYPELFD